MPEVGKVHNKAFAADNSRLYNLGGARGINLVNVAPNGVAWIHIVITAIGLLVWTLPLSQIAGIGPRDMGGLALILLLGPPILLTVLAAQRFKQDLSLSQIIMIRINHHIRQSSHYAGNATFRISPAKPIVAHVFMPYPADNSQED